MKKFLVTAILSLCLASIEAQALTPPPFIRGDLVCAKNVNRFLQKIGHRTTKSASSTSFLIFRRTAVPMPGDVVFNTRVGNKGHVQIYNGNGMCWNPSQRKQKWELKPCNATWKNKHKTFLRPR